MRTTVAPLLLLFTLATHTGCSANPSAAADVSGAWTGTYADTKSGVTGPLAASFSEQNGTVTGSLTISSGWLCSATNQGSVSGSVDGSQVQASATFGAITALSFTGNVTGNSMSGTYQITSGLCAGGTGSFSLSR